MSLNKLLLCSTKPELYTYNLPLDVRLKQSTSIRKKYADRVPILIHTVNIDINKIKFLVPKDITVNQLLYSIRKHITNIHSTEAIFIFVRNIIPNQSLLISELDKLYIEEDGFIHITLTKEATFG